MKEIRPIVVVVGEAVEQEMECLVELWRHTRVYGEMERALKAAAIFLRSL